MLQSFVLSFHFLHCFVSCISLMANFSLSDPSFLVLEIISSEINGGTMSLRLGIRHYAKKEVNKEWKGENWCHWTNNKSFSAFISLSASFLVFRSLANLSLSDPSFYVSQMICPEINEGTRASRLGICHCGNKDVEKESKGENCCHGANNKSNAFVTYYCMLLR